MARVHLVIEAQRSSPSIARLAFRRFSPLTTRRRRNCLTNISGTEASRFPVQRCQQAIALARPIRLDILLMDLTWRANWTAAVRRESSQSTCSLRHRDNRSNLADPDARG